MSDQIRLYDIDPYQFETEAVLKACLPSGEGMLVLPDRTPFFPGGGGQDPDPGFIDGIPVRNTVEKEGEIWLEVTGDFHVGDRVLLRIDPRKRRDDAEVHSGEHILSGTALRLFSVRNVGFHMGSGYATADFDRELSQDDLLLLERETNRLIRENLPVRISYPAPEELSKLSLRKMPETEEPIRVVTVEGADNCACCGTHVRFSGEIGLLRIFSSMRLRGGTRVFFLCGRKALEASAGETRILSESASLYSTSPEKLPEILGKRLEEERAAKAEIGSLERELAALLAEKLTRTDEGRVEATLSASLSVLRETAKKICEKEGASAFLRNGEFYVLAKHPSSKDDLVLLNAELRKNGARGGGRGDFYSGKLSGE